MLLDAQMLLDDLVHSQRQSYTCLLDRKLALYSELMCIFMQRLLVPDKDGSWTWPC